MHTDPMIQDEDFTLPPPCMFDRAQLAEERAIADGIARVRHAMAHEEPHSGKCLYCEADLLDDVFGEPLARFCDGDCREDFERQERAARRNGARHV